MQMSVREELEKLTRLQEIDLKIDRARKLKASAPQATVNLERELASQRSAFDQAKTTEADMEKLKRTLEMENMMDQDRIKNIESRLSNITNNKEYHAAAKEAEKAKKTISDREKQVTELREKLTAQATTTAEVQAKIDALDKQIESKRSEVGNEVTEAEKEINAYDGDRKAIVSEINAPLMSRYNRIRTRYSDAVTYARNGHCTSCNVALPPQLYNQLQKGLELITCPSCQRLLLYKVQ